VLDTLNVAPLPDKRSTLERYGSMPLLNKQEECISPSIPDLEPLTEDHQNENEVRELIRTRNTTTRRQQV
jgi:hypothetical protein